MDAEVGVKKATFNPGPVDQEDGDGAEDEERECSEGAEANPGGPKSSRLQRPTFVTSPAYFNHKYNCKYNY